MTEHLYVEIGRRIATARKRVGLNQTKLARALRISRGSVANMEVGRQRAPIHRLQQIAVICETELLTLLPSAEMPLPSGDDVVQRLREVAGLRRSSDFARKEGESDE